MVAGQQLVVVVDCVISPEGDLVVCTHTGKPDWGNGPQGQGRVFKIRYRSPSEPQPVLVWPESETETVIAFDRPLADGAVVSAKGWTLKAGRYVDAGDRFETMRPGYGVIAMQQRQAKSHSLQPTKEHCR